VPRFLRVRIPRPALKGKGGFGVATRSLRRTLTAEAFIGRVTGQRRGQVEEGGTCRPRPNKEAIRTNHPRRGKEGRLRATIVGMAQTRVGTGRLGHGMVFMDK